MEAICDMNIATRDFPAKTPYQWHDELTFPCQVDCTESVVSIPEKFSEFAITNIPHHTTNGHVQRVGAIHGVGARNPARFPHISGPGSDYRGT